MYIYIYVYIYIYIVCVCVYTHARTVPGQQAPRVFRRKVRKMYTHVHTCIHTYVCTYVCTRGQRTKSRHARINSQYTRTKTEHARKQEVDDLSFYTFLPIGCYCGIVSYNGKVSCSFAADPWLPDPQDLADCWKVTY